MKIIVLMLILSATPSKAAFFAAAGKIDITPNFAKERIYLAGYGAKGRRTKIAHDPLHARAMVVSDGSRTVAFVAVDSIGLYRLDILELRRMLGWTQGRNYLFVAATHSHAAPDTLGLWGPLPATSGVNKRYHRRMKHAIVDLVRDLSTRMQEADLKAAKALVPPKGLCRDSRDPIVIDPELNVLQVRGKDKQPIGTLVRWSCHPEVLDDKNMQASADFPGPLCEKIERDTGGACVFFSGVIGGLLGPDVDRAPGHEHQFKEMVRVGEDIAGRSLKALSASRDVYQSPTVMFSSAAVRVPVENSRYLALLRALTFGHRLYDVHGSELATWKTYWYPLRHLLRFPLPDDLRPWVETEVSLVRLGPVKILGVPGEMFPELAIGGYTGAYRYGYPLSGPTNPNPPQVKLAPKPPYLREQLGAKHGLIIGLANDEIGYIIPSYDFQVTPTRLMTPKPKGTHYEETNSIGRQVTGLLLEAYKKLLR
jgi:hypothetical protein